MWNATNSSIASTYGYQTATSGMHPGTCNRPHAPPTPVLRQKETRGVISDPNFTMDQLLSAVQGDRAMPPMRTHNGLHAPTAPG